MMIEFTEDQLNALDALLLLAHYDDYDDLAIEWYHSLPLEILVYCHEQKVARRETR